MSRLPLLGSHDALLRPERLAPLLAETLDDQRWLELSADLVEGGKSNLTFRLSSPAGDLILRRPPSGKLLQSAHDMGREARIQKALADTGVPVPDVIFQETGGLIGVPFYVMSLVPGHVIREHLPPGYAESDEEKTRLVDSLVDVLADLHAVDPAQVGLSDYGRPTGFLERQIRRWNQQWNRSKSRDVGQVDELADRLSGQLPTQQAESIVHGDYRLDNCLMDPVEPGRVAAVIDWELSTLGDPLTDLGMLMFYWREPGEPQRVLTPTVTAAAGFPGRDHILKRYAERTGTALDEIAFYTAFAHFKFAVVAQGIAARVAAGSMAGQNFGDLNDEVASIAESGLRTLDGKE